MGSTSREYVARSRILGSCSVHAPTLVGTTSSPLWFAPVYPRESPLSMYSLTLQVFLPLRISQVTTELIVWILISLIMKWNPFHRLLGHLNVFFSWNVYSSSSAHLSIASFVFFLLICRNSLYVLNIDPLSDTCIMNTFFHFVGYLSLSSGCLLMNSYQF